MPSLKAWSEQLGGIPFPLLSDYWPHGKVGKAYGARTTPHLYVVDAKGTLVYAGGIDDRTGVAGAVERVERGDECERRRIEHVRLAYAHHVLADHRDRRRDRRDPPRLVRAQHHRDDEAGEQEPEGEDDVDQEMLRKPKKSKAKAKAPKKPKAKKGAKTGPMRALWVVFGNSQNRVASYPYSQEKEAREHAEKLNSEKPEKKGNHFVMMVKEPME